VFTPIIVEEEYPPRPLVRIHSNLIASSNLEITSELKYIQGRPQFKIHPLKVKG